MTRIKAVLIAIDQLAAAIIIGWPDATLSAVAWVWERGGHRSWPRRWIDRLFFWDPNHCRESYKSEFSRSQFPPGFFLEI